MTTTGLLPSDVPLHDNLRAHARAAPDKAAIKAALLAGIEVIGAKLAQGTRLDVR